MTQTETFDNVPSESYNDKRKSSEHAENNINKRKQI